MHYCVNQAERIASILHKQINRNETQKTDIDYFMRRDDDEEQLIISI